MIKKSKLYFLLSEEINPKKDTLSFDDNVSKLINKLNLYLKKDYSGKYKFNLLSNDEGIIPDKLKMNPKKKRAIKRRWIEFNSELSEIQRNWEKELQEQKVIRPLPVKNPKNK